MGDAVPGGSLILLADDDRDNRELLSQILRLQHFETAEAFDGPGLIESAARLQPQLILTDVRLRRIDGFEAAVRLKADPSTARIPIVALTGYTPPDLERKARSAGIDEVVLKPVSPDDLIATLQRVLTRSAALREEKRALCADAHELRQQAGEKCAEAEAVNERARRLTERAREIVTRKLHTD